MSTVLGREQENISSGFDLIPHGNYCQIKTCLPVMEKRIEVQFLALYLESAGYKGAQ